MFCLSPFLNKGIILATFSLSGKIPEDIDLLNMSHRGSAIKCMQSFTTLGETSSGPLALNGFKVLL